jgi:hypothetical protein
MMSMSPSMMITDIRLITLGHWLHGSDMVGLLSGGSRRWIGGEHIVYVNPYGGVHIPQLSEVSELVDRIDSIQTTSKVVLSWPVRSSDLLHQFCNPPCSRRPYSQPPARTCLQRQDADMDSDEGSERMRGCLGTESSCSAL